MRDTSAKGVLLDGCKRRREDESESDSLSELSDLTDLDELERFVANLLLMNHPSHLAQVDGYQRGPRSQEAAQGLE